MPQVCVINGFCKRKPGQTRFRGARIRLEAGTPKPQAPPMEPKPWKFLGFPNSLYRDVIKDPKNFQCLGSLGKTTLNPKTLKQGFGISCFGSGPWDALKKSEARIIARTFLSVEIAEMRYTILMATGQSSTGFQNRRVSTNYGVFSGVPILWIIVYWDLYWGPFILGNDQ